MNDVDKIAGGGGAVFLAQLPDPWLSEECLRRCMALTERFPIVKKHVIGASLTGLALALTRSLVLRRPTQRCPTILVSTLPTMLM